MPISRSPTPHTSTPETVIVTQALRKRVDSKWITPYWTAHQLEYHTVENTTVYCIFRKTVLRTEYSDPFNTVVTLSITRNRGTDLETAKFGIPPFKKEDAHMSHSFAEYFTLDKFVAVPELAHIV